jgi:hypothetical protein
MAYGVPPLGATDQMATPKRPVSLAPNMGAHPRPAATEPSVRRVQMRPGRRPQATARRRPTPPGAPAGGGVPAQPIVDPMQFPPLAPEVADLGAAAALSRIHGVGRPGTERGVLNTKRRV